jgi:sugar/nucleoside kinase (ribokinase family)
MSLTVVGSVAFDAVETPFGKRDRMLGGAATHFALAASFFDQVHAVGVVGGDFGPEHEKVMTDRGIDTSDIERVEDGRTFFWAGRYHDDMNGRDTLDTQLNVFETFQPKLSEASRNADILFLANIQPDLQYEVRQQCTNAKFVAMDSMDLWINIARDSLQRTIESVDGLLLNDGELKMLTGKPNLVQAAEEVRSWGPKVVVAKLGEYGAALFTESGFFGLPAFPLHTVLDPTGAGDSFAGGFMGFIAAHRDEELDDALLRRAMAYGTAVASFNVEDFGTDRVSRLTADEITERVAELARITHFEDAPIELGG